MFSMANIKRRLSDQGGFSLAEVVMAVLLFSSAVVGISGLVISGGAGIARGASESAAANLANKKIEEIRSLPFYRTWENKNQDIDDFYYNMSVDNDQQIAHPGKSEGYVTIPGASNFRMEVAIQYQVPAESGMTPAEMALNWVPKSATAKLPEGKIDRPTTKDGQGIHSMMIEVAVYYRTNNLERVYRQRALAGDMIIPGGSSVPALMVLSVEPATGLKGDDDCEVKVNLSAESSISDGTFIVKLWASDFQQVGTPTDVVNQGQIRTHFDLSADDVTLGQYSISVEWVEEGWVDKNFRDCFQVLGPPSTITKVSDFNWGFRAQSARQVTVEGTNLTNPQFVGLVGPNEGGSDPLDPTKANSISIPGTMESSSDTKIVVDFNLTSVPADCLNTHWTVQVKTGGGVVDSNESNRVLVNPIPQVTSIEYTPSAFYRKATYANPITVKGKYFEPDSVPTMTLTKSSCTDITGNFATGGTVTEDPTLGTSEFTMSTLDLRREEKDSKGNVTVERPIKIGNGVNEVGNWNLYVTNPDGQPSVEDDILVPVDHAPMQVTNIANNDGSSIYYNDWDRRVTITGDYFYPGDVQLTFYDEYGLPGNFSITGDYGTGQKLGAAETDTLVMNTIGLTTPEYPDPTEVEVKDTENELSSTFALTVAEPAADAVTALPAGTTAPTGCDWLLTAGQANAFWNRSDVPPDNDVPGHDTDSSVTESNICYDNGTYTYKIIAKKMRNLNVRWSFTPSGGSELTFPATITLDRANKYVLATGSITWPNFPDDITVVDVKCSNDGGLTYGVLSPARIRVKKNI